jgi:NAD(P)-dependent dehydrogenase (short-subunit alcohol dehydrogenase family)
MRLKDKVVVVTGGAQGLGQAYALQFAQEGAKVVVCDVLDCGPVAQEIESMGGEVLSLTTDVTSEASTAEMAKKTSERFGKIDVLVNNAAIYGGIVMKPFHEVTTDEWDKLMAVNLKGMFLCCKAVFPFMKEQQKGKIVNIASAVAFSGVPNFIHYSASKGGVISFTRALARELGEYNINVNAVAPGLTMTQASLDMIPDQRIDMNIARLSIKRRQQPEDLLGAVILLSSEESDFISGQTLVVDGGSVMH